MSVHLDDHDARSLIEALDAYDTDIETLQSSKRTEIAALRVSINGLPERLKHCRDRIGPAPIKRCDRPAFSRGVGIASKLLGCDFQAAKVLLTQEPGCAGYDVAASAAAPNCPDDAVGFVYVAECPDHPGVRKIGFTSNLPRRGRQLVAEYRVAISFVAVAVGSYADEYALQRKHGHLWLTGEWFGRADSPRFCPDFIRAARGGPVRDLSERYLRDLGQPAALPNSGPFRTVSEEVEAAAHRITREVLSA